MLSIKPSIHFRWYMYICIIHLSSSNEVLIDVSRHIYADLTYIGIFNTVSRVFFLNVLLQIEIFNSMQSNRYIVNVKIKSIVLVPQQSWWYFIGLQTVILLPTLPSMEF